jgi:hypothetical protein
MAIATYARVCSKNVAGNSQIWITEASNITSITVTAGEAAAFTMDSGKKFMEHQPEMDSLIRTQEGAGIGSNISYNHKIDMKFAKLALGVNTMRNALVDGSPSGMVAVVKDSNGTYWLVGWNDTDLGNRGLELRQDNDNSGGLASDEEGGMANLILETVSGYLDIPLSTAGITSFDSASTAA